MHDHDIVKRIKKLEYHIKLLAEELNHDESPIASLVIGLDWSESELNIAHDIFEAYDRQLEAKEKNINWNDFENEFKEKLGVSYQRLKLIIIAFYKNMQWENVCYSYAASFGNTVPIELKQIARGRISVDLLSKPIGVETLLSYSKLKYPKLPVSDDLTKRLVSDLNLNRYRTLSDIDDVTERAKLAVQAYSKDEPSLFEYGTDYITKSLGFVDVEFRTKHGFGKKTRDAFQKYESLVKVR